MQGLVAHRLACFQFKYLLTNFIFIPVISRFIHYRPHLLQVPALPVPMPILSFKVFVNGQLVPLRWGQREALSNIIFSREYAASQPCPWLFYLVSHKRISTSALTEHGGINKSWNHYLALVFSLGQSVATFKFRKQASSFQRYWILLGFGFRVLTTWAGISHNSNSRLFFHEHTATYRDLYLLYTALLIVHVSQVFSCNNGQVQDS